MSEHDQQLTPNPEKRHAVCANCGARLHGPWCYACGQPVKSLIRHVLTLANDAMDLLFNIDGRVMHTLPALYLKPGFLTNEYLAGRRNRYVPPFRLMFVLSVLAFLLIQLSLNLTDDVKHLKINNDPFVETSTSAQVQVQLQQKIDGLENGIAAMPDLPGTAIAVDKMKEKEAVLRKQANARIAQLRRDGDATRPAGASSTLASLDTQLAAWNARIAKADTLDDLQGQLATVIKQVDTHLADPNLSTGQRTQWQAARQDLFTDAGKRMQALSVQSALPASTHNHHPISWLPDSLNAGLDRAVVRMRDNINRMRTDSAARNRFVAGIFNVLPPTMFVLMPFFALLLKFVYLLKRRLYMEHVIVAFHSHAFIFLSLVLLSILHFVKGWLAFLGGWATVPLGLLMAAAWIWLPVYLLIMQKRVYRQGWIMTSLKYVVVGICYMIMLSLAVAAAMLISLMD